LLNTRAGLNIIFMRARFISILLLVSIPVFLKAQVDSFETKEILLKEVIVQQGVLQTNNRQFLPDKNVQINTDRLLNGLGGVSMIKRGNYAWEPGIRGLNNGQITTTIDGMSIFGACTDRMDPASSYIEPGNLKSIAISYGNTESTGGNNIGGGFDFKTIQPVFGDKKIIAGMAAAGYETNGNAHKILTSVNYSNKRIGINVNGIYRASGNYFAGGRKVIDFSQYAKWNGGIGIKYKLNPHQWVLLNYIRDEGYNIGYPALTMDVLYAKANIVSLTHQIHFVSGIINKIENKIYFNDIDHAMDDTKRPAGQVFMHMDMPGTSRTFGFISTTTGEKGKHVFKARANVYQNKLHAEMTMYPDRGAPMFMLTLPDAMRSYAEAGLYDEWKMSKRLVLQSGVSGSLGASSIYSDAGRHTVSGIFQDYHSRTDFLYTVYANPVLVLSDKLNVFSYAGRTMRLPTLQELYGFYLFNRADNYDYLGSPQLKKETSWNFSAGIQVRNKNLKLSAKGFSYLMQNYIAGIPNIDFDKMTHSASGVKQYQNLAAASIFGFETDVEWKLGNILKFTSGNSFSYGKDHSGNALPLIPPFRSTGRFQFLWKQFSFQPEVIATAAQKHVSSVYGESATPSSFIMNFFIDRSFVVSSKKFHINAGVENIFDVKYYDHNDIMKILRPGRSFSLQWSWYF